MKDHFGAAPVDDRLVHQSDTVREGEVLPDDFEVVINLPRCEKPSHDGLSYGNERVRNARSLVAWVQQKLG